MDKGPQLGRLITDGERGRDAIHIAVAPVTVSVTMSPGQSATLVQDKVDEVIPATEDAIGILDPFLKEPIKKGERCWLFLFPNTITSLRHVWTHPVFTKAAAAARERL